MALNTRTRRGSVAQQKTEGNGVWGPFTIPLSDLAWEVSIDRLGEGWTGTETNTSVIEVNIEWRYVGETEWKPRGGFTTSGGIARDPRGLPSPRSGILLYPPKDATAPIQLRVITNATRRLDFRMVVDGLS